MFIKGLLSMSFCFRNDGIPSLAKNASTQLHVFPICLSAFPASGLCLVKILCVMNHNVHLMQDSADQPVKWVCRNNHSLAHMAVNMLLGGKKNEEFRFEIVITGLNMVDMDGFEFLQHVAHNLKVPVILMTDDDDTSMAIRGVECGACDCLLKPITEKDVQYIWQHAYCNRIYYIIGGQEDSHTTEIGQFGLMTVLKRKESSGREYGGNFSSSVKKPKVEWTHELHLKFLKAMEYIEENMGYKEITPKNILNLMGVPSLTRDHVSGHLQKYRDKLSRKDQKAAAQVSVGSNINPKRPALLHQNITNNETCGQNIQIQNQVVEFVPADQAPYTSPLMTNSQALPEQVPFSDSLLTNLQSLPATSNIYLKPFAPLNQNIAINGNYGQNIQIQANEIVPDQVQSNDSLLTNIQTVTDQVPCPGPLMMTSRALPDQITCSNSLFQTVPDPNDTGVHFYDLLLLDLSEDVKSGT